MQISETVQVTTELVALLEKIDNMSFDRLSIPQENLDLANKFRTSLFPWRGQFSPELVELLLNTYGKDSCTVHDPFVGSGTTLFEASRKGFRCYASEINPSAVEMAKTAHFVNLTLSERKHFIQQAVAIAENVVRPLLWDLFSYQENDPTLHQDEENWLAMAFTAELQKVTRHPYVHNLLVNAFIRYMSYPPPRKDTDLLRAVQEHANIIKSLPYTTSETKVFHADARAIPLPASSIDLIITSPPYINVFNYHQNNRSAMELLGWNLLNIAKSEIGSNRKHRQNRFLTVIQYIYDMVDVFHEMKRLLHPEGKAIIIVGRESNVRGMPFKNGLIVAASALGSGNFQLEMRQERKFKNKFGEIIYEDILHLLPVSQPRRTHENFPESLALWSLMED